MLIPAVKIESVNLPNARRIDQHLIALGQPVLPQGIAELKALGVTVVIDLQSNEVAAEAGACAFYAIQFYSIPLPAIELFSRPDHKLMAEIAWILDNVGGTTAVHCLRGKDRTGDVVGQYRVRHGATQLEAIAENKLFGGGRFPQEGYLDDVEDYDPAKG